MFDLPRKDESKYIQELISSGNSLTSTREVVEVDEFQEMKIVERKPKKTMSDNEQNLSVEDKILRDFEKEGKVIWHTYTGDPTPIEEMDLDMRILAALHSLKTANKYHEKIKQYNNQWKHFRPEVAKKKRNMYMHIFEELEDNLQKHFSIHLPEKVEDIKSLRENLKRKMDSKNLGGNDA